MNSEIVRQMIAMRHSPIRNYIVPGLTSWLIGGGDNSRGKVRLFENTREQHEFITPHSHRFSFNAYVIRGWVSNTTWFDGEGSGDLYMASIIRYDDSPGKYTIEKRFQQRFLNDTITYGEGEWYCMHLAEIHSIKFSENALVLFFEGPTLFNTSQIIEPIVDEEHIPTMKIEPWMFRRGE